ncbi:MAG: D-aminoacyl-tRNA deacylase [Oscillospiraceae bacterium]|nr:D-aminoacyl-tRNA deacylase [Oscillospiraceae bacterium]
MKIVLTRVKNASVEADGRPAGSIGTGFLILLGVETADTEADAEYCADRVCGLRVFEDAAGKMNVSPSDAGAELLVISQFTLCADISKRRPGFTGAARPDQAVPLYERFMALCRERGFAVQSGVFGADMQVFSQNDGPVTIWIDSKSR